MLVSLFSRSHLSGPCDQLVGLLHIFKQVKQPTDFGTPIVARGVFGHDGGRINEPFAILRSILLEDVHREIAKRQFKTVWQRM